jgi:type II secretion system protein H
LDRTSTGAAAERVRSEGAFTLIELVVVVAIVGLVLSTVAIRFDSVTQSARLRASAREIASTVGLAHSQAGSTGTAHNIVFDTDNSQYWIEPEQGVSGRDWLPRKRYLYRDIEFKDIQVGEEVYSERGTLSIGISPLGITSACMVHLQSQEGQELTVEVCPLTGMVRFYDGYQEYEPPEDLGG